MGSEVAQQQQQTKRPTLEGHRSHSSSRTPAARHVTETSSDSLSTTPPSAHRLKAPKAHHHHHHVASRTNLHTRVPSYGKGLHKLNKAHAAAEGYAHKTHRRPPSPATSPPVSPMKRAGSKDKLSRNGSAASLKKDSSQSQLKRNRSSGEVKRPKSSGTLKRSSSQPGVNNPKGLNRTSVHFDLGNEGDDGWTEASASASPSMSRSGSIGGPSNTRASAKPHASASNSEAQSLAGSPKTNGHKHERHPTPDARQITSRLLQRNPSNNAPPQMSSVSATATPTSPATTLPHSETFGGSSSTLSGSRSAQGAAVSRFVGSASGTPQDNTTFLASRDPNPQPDRDVDLARRVKSMGNMVSKDTKAEADSDDERILAPRSRNSSKHAYNPPQQSRTQQKLWLQRASSNIEPQQLAPSGAMGMGGFPGLFPGMTSSSLVGAGYDGKDPRIRLQLERTGMEYLVVRRYQDPVGRALRRLEKLPGNEKMRRIPSRPKTTVEGGRGRYGLSQSLKEGREKEESKVRQQKSSTVNASGARSSYEGQPTANGSAGSERSGTAVEEDSDATGVSAMLRSLWEKSFEASPSVE
ncbi:MAG: hypothetical protein M1818_003325 [Claussenomyces sp. TS43310]|nr:MAG: hypothetical protein M1818_003325 [Claussenomyces sp. TS43310]